MGSHVKASIENIGTYCLILDIGHCLDLPKTLYVPSMSRNLVSLSKLDICGVDFNSGYSCFNLYKNSKLIGFSILIDGLYRLKLNN